MNYQEIEKTLCYYKKESSIFMPNEIFEDLKDHIKAATHIPVAYAYYYLNNWMYRYTKYQTINLDVKRMKQTLGYNGNAKEINHIMKKNGILDTMGYTETIKNFPVLWELRDGEDLKFTRIDDYDEVDKAIQIKDLSRKYSVQFPIKAFHRHMEDAECREEYENKGYEDGTYFEFDNTHLVPFEVFMYCMSNKKIGCTGFYIYSFIKMKNQHFNGKYDCPMEGLADILGLPSSTMKPYLATLRKHKLVEGVHNMDFFCTALEDHKRKANSYIANEFTSFSDEPIEYEKMKIMEAKEYYQMLEDKRKEEEGEREEFPLELLPY